MSADWQRMSALDRVIAAISPSTAVDRLRARATLSAAGGYKGARRDRRATKSWNPGGGSADADTLPDLGDLRDRTRDLARNAPLATGAIATTTTHVVGLGLVPNAAIDREALGLDEAEAEAWERAAEREFRAWAKCADLAETMSFDAVQELVFRSALESGDILAIRRHRQRPGSAYALRLQLVEADRISNPNRRADAAQLAGGVQTDADGRPLAFHCTDRHPGDPRAGLLSWSVIPARFDDGRPVCLHVVDRLRPGQSRGVPFLAPVIEALKELDKFSEAELRAAVVSALFTVFVEREKDNGGSIVDRLPTATDGSGDIELHSGAIVDLAPGETANIANPGRPNPQFDPFVLAVLRQVGVGLELPFELLVKHFTASYSASRAALELANLSFSRRRRWLVRTFCRPVWEMVIEEAVLRGRLQAPGFLTDPVKREAWLGVEWIGPSRISLDPLKEAKADEVDLSTGVKTRNQITQERTGGDWMRKTEQLGREGRARQAAGISDAAAPSQPVDPVAAQD